MTEETANVHREAEPPGPWALSPEVARIVKLAGPAGRVELTFARGAWRLVARPGLPGDGSEVAAEAADLGWVIGAVLEELERIAAALEREGEVIAWSADASAGDA